MPQVRRLEKRKIFILHEYSMRSVLKQAPKSQESQIMHEGLLHAVRKLRATAPAPAVTCAAPHS